MRRLAPFAVLVAALVVSAAGGEPAATPTPVRPIAAGETVVIAADGLAFVIHAPADGSVPVVVCVLSYGEGQVVPVPPVPPPPRRVAGVLIIEEQADRTPEQAKVMDDPAWQTAATEAGLTWAIEDDDGKRAVPFLAAIKVPLPVVVSIDADGKPVAVVPLPAAVEEMRALIGGAE